MLAALGYSKPGKVFLNQAAPTIMEIQKSPKATAEIIFVKNRISLCTVVSLSDQRGRGKHIQIDRANFIDFYGKPE